MSARMATPGPIMRAGSTWAEQVARDDARRPRGWEGFKIGPESDLKPEQIKALADSGQLWKDPNAKNGAGNAGSTKAV